MPNSSETSPSVGTDHITQYPSRFNSEAARSREAPLLGAVLIVKDEEARLPAALSSLQQLRPILGEICVYDTGSTDGTITTAERFGAKVVKGYWDGDFARARNAAVAMSAAKWLLTIDADETVSGNARVLGVHLREMLTRDLVGLDAGLVRFDLLHEGRVAHTLRQPRLFRRSRAEFCGRIHEELVARTPPHRMGEVPETALTMSHHGYTDAAMRVKGERNLALAEADLQRAGGAVDADSGLLMNRARSRYMAGDMDGYETDLRALRRLPNNDGNRRWAGEQLVVSCTQRRQFSEAEALLVQLRKEGSDPQQLDWLEAQMHTAAGRHVEALTLLRRVEAPVSAAGIASDPAEYVEARMAAAVRCGEIDEATACCLRLVTSHGRVREYAAFLVRLWGDRSAAVLAQLLSETGGEHLPTAIAELEEQGGAAREVAKALNALRSKPWASSQPRVRQGAAFGL